MHPAGFFRLPQPQPDDVPLQPLLPAFDNNTVPGAKNPNLHYFLEKLLKPICMPTIKDTSGRRFPTRK